MVILETFFTRKKTWLELELATYATIVNRVTDRTFFDETNIKYKINLVSQEY